MPRTRRFKILWAAWMTGGGLAAALVAYLVTRSVTWTIVTLLLSGVVLNAIGQAVTPPAAAVSSSRRGRGSGARV